MRAEIDCSAHRLRFSLVSESQAELPIDLGFVGGVGVANHAGDVAERSHEVRDLRSAHPARAGARLRVKISFGSSAFGLGLGDPAGDHRGVCTGVEGGAVPLQLGVAVRDDGLGCRGKRGWMLQGLGCRPSR